MTKRQPRTASQILMAEMSEIGYQSSVIQLAERLGWIQYHVRDSRNVVSSKGFPDVVLAHPQHGILFWEFKTETGRPSADQVTWITTLQAAGAEAEIVRPRYHDTYVIPRLAGKPCTLPSVTAGTALA